MRLEGVYQEVMPSGRVRLYGEASYDLAERGMDVFYFEYPADMADYIVDTGDPWLALFLPISVELNETLHITRPVDPVLLEGCLEILEIWNCWMPDLPIIRIQVDAVQVAELGDDKTASFFSGGVDSMYTLFSNEVNPRKQRVEKIDDLITIFGLFGREDALVEQQRGLPMLRRIENIAKLYDKKVIEVHTNVYKTHYSFTNSLNHSHGCLLAASLLAIGKRYARVLIPTSVTYKDIAPGGSHPLTDRLLSTSMTRMIPEGGALTRFQKIRCLIQSNHDLASLQVCSRDNDLKNCSNCFKCLRDMLILEALNKLGDCELFRDKKIDFNKISRMYCSTAVFGRLLNVLSDEATKYNRQDIIESIKIIHKRSEWIAHARMLVKRLRHGGLPSAKEFVLLKNLITPNKRNRYNANILNAIADVLQRLPEFHDFLLTLLQKGESFIEGSEIQLSMSKYEVKDEYYRYFEHALLVDSICESTLDIQLRNINNELREPGVVYVNDRLVTNA